MIRVDDVAGKGLSGFRRGAAEDTGSRPEARRALALRPEERCPTAAAMLEALMALLPDGVALHEDMLVATPEAGRSTVQREIEAAAPHVATLLIGAAKADADRT